MTLPLPNSCRRHSLTGASILLGLALTVASATPAGAEPRCTGKSSAGSPFAICFDPGNRLFLATSTGGYGGGVRLRQLLRFADEPDLVWKLDHEIATVTAASWASRYRAALYSGRYLRHARDGHVVLPFSVGRKLFLPFDIGASASVGTITGRADRSAVEIGVVNAAALIDIARSPSFRRRLAIGMVVRWDATVDPRTTTVGEQVVAPLTSALVDIHFESANGLTLADLRTEFGKVWSSSSGWRQQLLASASLERVLIAVNDRPLSLTLGARYHSNQDELLGELGLRFALFQRRHRRVILEPLKH